MTNTPQLDVSSWSPQGTSICVQESSFSLVCLDRSFVNFLLKVQETNFQYKLYILGNYIEG